MTREPLIFREIRVQRAPGFERQGFTLRELSPGINVVYGPNGAGKSTTARAVVRLLWPALSARERVALEGRVRLGGDEWLVEVEGGRAGWLRDGEPTPPPRLPAAEVHPRYRLALHDLLREKDADFAAAIARESAGGYDVRSSGAVLEARLPSPGRNSRLHQALQRAKAAYESAVAEQRALRERERVLDALRLDYQAADAARRRVVALQAALEHARAREEEENALAELQRFEAGMERVGGKEHERLCTLREKVREIEAKATEARREATEARARREALGISAEALRDELLRGLEADLDRLRAFEQEVGRLRGAHARAAARLEQGMERLGGVVDAERLAAVDLSSIGDVSDFGLRAEAVAARRARVQEQLAALPQSDTAADVERLRDGIALLRHWLREPRPAPAPAVNHSGRLPGTVAALFLVVLGLVLGFTVSPAYHAAALVGAVLLGWLWRSPAPAPEVPDRPAMRREDYEQLGLDTPDVWQADSVTELLERLQARADAARDARRALERREELARALVAIEAEETRLEAEGAAVAERLGIGSCSAAGIVWAVEAIGRWQQYREEEAGCAAELLEAESLRDGAVASLRDRLAPLGFNALETVGMLEGAVRAFRDRREAYRREEAALIAAAANAERLRIERAERVAEIERLFATLGLQADADDTVRAWCEAHADYRRAHDRHREATAVRTAAVLRMRACDAEEDLAGHPAAELDEMLQAEKVRAERRDELAGSIRETETLISQAKRSHDVEAALAEVDRATQVLIDARDSEMRSAVAHELIEALERATRDQHLPAVFIRARERFSRITHGRYELRIGSDGDPAFSAFDTVDDRLRGLEELSSGTRVQLLLAVRVAFVEEQEEGVMLPLLLDEVLGNSDDERARAIMHAVASLAAEGRQILYFTAQVDEVARWRSLAAEGGLDAGVGLREIDLGVVRGHERRLEIPDVVQPAYRQPPAANGHDHAAYGRLLGVPRIDRAGDAAGAVHLWYLVEEPELLHRLLVLGSDRWGPLRALLRDGGRELVDNAIQQHLDVQGRVLDAFVDAARTGVGPPVDHAVLEDSGAVTPVFIDRVTAAAAAVGGDAGRLMEALENGAVSGFRQKARLREYLEEGGFLPQERPLGLPEIRSRVLSRVAPDVSAGRMTVAELDRIVGRLWQGVISDQ